MQTAERSAEQTKSRAPSRSRRLRKVLAGGVIVGALAVPAAASAAVASTTHALPMATGASVTKLCGPEASFRCATGGYDGTAAQIGGNGWATWQYWAYGSAVNATQRHNCTTYAAFKLQRNGAPYPGWTGNARDWDTKAAAAGTRVDQAPAVGAVAQWNGGTLGHVAYVETVTPSYIEVTDDAYGSNRTSRIRIATGSNAWPDNFLHFKDVVAAPPAIGTYANTLVRWTGDSRTTWFVTPDLRRLWIPDGGTYNELKARGFAGPVALDSATLNRLPDQSGLWVASGASWTANRTLRRGMSVRSSDGRYLFAMQHDGNLVLYGPSGRALWATSGRTAAWTSQEYVVFQGDGNLVTYGGGRAIWASGTAGRGADRFVIQSDGNLVIYRGSTPLWASNTAGRV
jgi:surface antigen